MKKTLWILPLLLLTVVFGAWGCGKSASQKAAESAAEKAIEKSTNGAADVDLDSGSLKVNINGASWQAGTNVTKPSGFPSDIYVIDGTLTGAITTVENKSYTLTIATSTSVADAKQQYESRLASEGWTTTSSASFGGTEMIIAEKANRVLTVSIGSDLTNTSTTSVVITTSTKDDGTNTNTATTNSY